MKISKIEIHNFLALEHVLLNLQAPVNLIVGENEQGKSSIRDALQVTLAGQARGLKTHADQAAFIKDGAKAAEVIISLPNGKGIAWRKTPKTPATVSGDLPSDQVMMSILADPLVFLSLEDKARREILFNLLPGLNPKGEDIYKRLLEAIPDIDLGSTIPHDLARIAATQGFKAAENEAIESRKVAKRIIKEFAVTEPETQLTIGGVLRILPDIQQADVESGLSTLRGERDKLQKKLGKAEAKADKLPELEAELTTLEAGAPDPQEEGEIERHTKALEINRGLVTDLQAKITAMTAGSDPQNFPTLCPVHKIGCPSAGKEAIPGTKPKDVDPAVLKKAQADMAEIQKEVDLIDKDLKEAQLAQAVYIDYGKQKQTLEAKIAKVKEQEAQAPATAEIEGQITALDARIQTGLDLLDAVRDFWRKKEAADAAAVKLARAEKEVGLYDSLAKALAPAGIPSALIAEALGPVNERLAYASGYLFPNCDKHDPVHLTDDLEVYRGAMPYSLLSKSARYRAGICFQYALAIMAGARLMMIDEADILDPQNRAQLIDFLLTIRESFDTILCFATSDHADPSPVPELAVWWIEGGQVTAVMAKEAA